VTDAEMKSSLYVCASAVTKPCEPSKGVREMKKRASRGACAGKILRVDLGNGKVSTEDTEKYAREWLGGRSINSFILLDELDPNIKWSHPGNLLIFGAGALVGTPSPGACRLSIETKNVFSGGKGSANVGGHFAPELKYAGFDHIVIKGKAENPVYLWVHDGQAELREAGFLWGKTISATEEALAKRHAPHRIRVAAIGPAGENLVKGAGIVCDRAKVAGGSGVGCVMGDKKLKAVVACGEHGSIEVADPEAFFQAVENAARKIKKSPLTEGMKRVPARRWSDPGLPSWDVLVSARNGQDDYWEIEKRIRLANSESGFPKYMKNISSCFACPIACMPFLEIDEGDYAGTRGEGFWINAILDAVRLDITDPGGMIKAWILSNELGLDTDFATSVISWYFECYEKGLVTAKDSDGLKLEWGNVDAYLALLRKIAYRRGVGDFLARGVKEASRQIGRGSEAFAIHMKGQDSIEPYRIGKGWALGVATSPVAGRHLRGTCMGGDRFGPKQASFEPHTYEDKAEYVNWQLLTKEMEDTLGICVYVGTWSGAYALEPSDYVALINAAMGTDLSEEGLFYAARRSYNLEKAFNTLHAKFDRRDDYPPERFMREPVKSGPYKGFRCEKEAFDKMLDEFYRLLDWDQETGLQTERALKELKMENVAAKLERAGMLIKS